MASANGTRKEIATGNTSHLDRIAAFLRARRQQDVSLSDVVALAEITAESLQTFFATMDSAIYRELREIAEFIVAMKVEIGVLKVNEIKETRIPAAGQELSAIVKATENATNTIMECAETLMGADSSNPDAFKALVDEKMMLIFEACSFQDITGQRVAKVIDTLEQIEARVSRFAAAIHAKDVDTYVNDKERERAERKERLMLNGPAAEGKGMAQSDVDRLLG